MKKEWRVVMTGRRGIFKDFGTSEARARDFLMGGGSREL